MQVNSVSDHAVARFRKRFGGKASSTKIRKDIVGLLYSAVEVGSPYPRQNGDNSKYYHVDGITFVVRDGTVVTALFGDLRA